MFLKLFSCCCTLEGKFYNSGLQKIQPHQSCSTVQAGAPPPVPSHFRDVNIVSQDDSECYSLLSVQAEFMFSYDIANKGWSSQDYGFSSGYVWMWELDY